MQNVKKTPTFCQTMIKKQLVYRCDAVLFKFTPWIQYIGIDHSPIRTEQLHSRLACFQSWNMFFFVNLYPFDLFQTETFTYLYKIHLKIVLHSTSASFIAFFTEQKLNFYFYFFKKKNIFDFWFRFLKQKYNEIENSTRMLMWDPHSPMHL